MKTIVLLTFLAFFIACNPKVKENGYSIDGSITGYDSSYVQLKKFVDGDFITMDSTLVSKGKFNINGTVKMPDLYYLVFGDLQHKTRIFLENSDITFNAHFDSLDVASIKGSKSHVEYVAYQDEIRPYENKMADLYQQYKAASDQKNKLLMNQLDSTMTALDRDMNNFIKNYIGTHKSLVIVPYILYTISYSMEAKELDSLLGTIDKNLDSSIYTKNLKNKVEILKNVEIGKQAPDITLNDTAGKPVSLSSFKGKYVLIDFWASWCGDCRRENPNNVKLYQDFNKKGLEIFGISLDRNRGEWVNAIKKDKLSWTHVSDLKFWYSAAAKLYGISSIPHTFLINKEGVIIAKNLYGDELRAKVKEVLK
jgi:peroxiredoxin